MTAVVRVRRLLVADGIDGGGGGSNVVVRWFRH